MPQPIRLRRVRNIPSATPIETASAKIIPTMEGKLLMPAVTPPPKAEVLSTDIFGEGWTYEEIVQHAG